MPANSQLARISPRRVAARVAADQALTLKELAVHTGLPYSTVRAWPAHGLPLIDARIFYSDFVLWRRQRAGLAGESSPRKPADRRRRTAGKSDGSLSAHD